MSDTDPIELTGEALTIEDLLSEGAGHVAASIVDQVMAAADGAPVPAFDYLSVASVLATLHVGARLERVAEGIGQQRPGTGDRKRMFDESGDGYVAQRRHDAMLVELKNINAQLTRIANALQQDGEETA